ncbi:MAG TPA: hypothetical protein VFI49_03895 [Rudaea sp.]|nr:hypothetical protein [Rudaea sp.]
MKTRQLLVTTIGMAGLLSLSAWAQSSPQALDLKLPTDNAAVDAADVETERHGGTVSPSSAMPSAFHYDDPNPRNRLAGAPACDDAIYNQPQVHGSVSAGVAGGNHSSGNYQSAVVHVTKALGSCEAPSGGVGVSIGVSKEDFNGPHGRHH